MSSELILFYALAFVAVASSLAMVCFVRDLRKAVVCLLVTMVSLACVMLLLVAPAVAAAQLFVHTAAVVLLFRTAIARLGLEGGFTARNFSEGTPKAVVAGAVFLIATAFAIFLFRDSPTIPVTFGGSASAGVGTPALSGALLLAGIAALVCLAVTVGVRLLAGRSRD